METKASLREYLFMLFDAAGIKSAADDADKISEKFSNLLYVLHLDAYNLSSISGCSDAAADLIRLTAALTSRRITDRFKPGRKYTEEQIRDLAVGKLFGVEYESVYALLFDKSDRFLACEHVCDGVVNAAGIVPRKIIDAAKRQGAVSVIVIHNHPRGNTEPSDDDMTSTMNIKYVLSSAGIECKHSYIVSGFDVFDAIGFISEAPVGAELRVSSSVVTPKK